MASQRFTLCERHFRICVWGLFVKDSLLHFIIHGILFQLPNNVARAPFGALALGLSFACLTKYILIKIVLFGASCRQRGSRGVPWTWARARAPRTQDYPPLRQLATPTPRGFASVGDATAACFLAPIPATRWKSEIKA